MTWYISGVWDAAPCEGLWPFRSGASAEWDYRLLDSDADEVWHILVHPSVLKAAGRSPDSVTASDAVCAAGASALEAGLRAIAQAPHAAGRFRATCGGPLCVQVQEVDGPGFMVGYEFHREGCATYPKYQSVRITPDAGVITVERDPDVPVIRTEHLGPSSFAAKVEMLLDLMDPRGRTGRDIDPVITPEQARELLNAACNPIKYVGGEPIESGDTERPKPFQVTEPKPGEGVYEVKPEQILKPNAATFIAARNREMDGLARTALEQDMLDALGTWPSDEDRKRIRAEVDAMSIDAVWARVYPDGLTKCYFCSKPVIDGKCSRCGNEQPPGET